jgi:hypothetical protein
MAKQKAQLGARGLHGLVESRSDGGRNQEQKTKNHSLGPNTSDEENYQIRKMKTKGPHTSDLKGKHSHEEVIQVHRTDLEYHQGRTISTKSRCQKEIFIELK